MCRKLIKFGKVHVICKCTSNAKLQAITEIDRIRASNYTKGARKVFVFLVMAFVSSLCITPKIVFIILYYIHILNVPIDISERFQDYEYFFYKMKLATIINILQCVQFLNHGINPIVYGLFDLQFRKRCVMLYKRCWSNTRD